MTLSRYLALLRPHAPALAGAALLLALTAAVPGIAVGLLKQALDALLAASPVLPWGGALVGLYVLHAGGVVARTAITKHVAWSLASDLRRALHARWLAAAPSGAVGDRLAALTDEVDQVQYGVSAGVTALRNPLALAGLLGAAAWVAPSLGLPAVAALAPVAAVAWLGGRRVRSAAARSREARAALTALAQEQLASLPTLQAFAALEDEVERFAITDERDRRARLRLEIERGLPALATQVLAATALVGLLVLGAPRCTPAELVAFVAALGLAARPLSGLAEVWALLQRSLSALERVERALSEAPEIDEPVDPRPLPTGPLDLEWDGVTARVGERAIVERVHLVARPGEVLALVGPTGAGKTTLLRLAWRALDPDEGAVRLGGVDLRQVSTADRQRAVAVVLQDLVVLGRTVLENVALGDPHPDPPRAADALRLAGATFALDAGLDHVLPEGGSGWSGGERQRLCLARALYRRSRVLLLDEPTSQVDPETTRAIAETLRRLRPGRTLVVVAHDPALAEHADRVVTIGSEAAWADSSAR